MNKILITLVAILSCYIIIGSKVEETIIPDEAIRVRVIANSNSVADQNIKKEVKEIVEKDMYETLKNTKDVTIAREEIQSELPFLEKKLDTFFNQGNYPYSYQIKFGYNYFPEKKYKGVTYQEGLYESLVVELGSAEGDNWWCVLFPPLCLLEAEESSEVEYRSFVKEMMEKYF